MAWEKQHILKLVAEKLTRLPAQTSLTTSDLITWLVDETEITNKEAASLLMRSAERELAPYATKGDPIPGKGFQTGNVVRPWIWHAPVKTASLSRPSLISSIGSRPSGMSC